MEQLELRFYTRQEIADVLSVNINDSNHFKRNIEAKLQRWGYGYDYSRSGVKITSRPEAAEERLAEILYRHYKLDVQTNPTAFACFLHALMEIEDFDSMPWEERANILFREYLVQVCDRTLRNWASKLFALGILYKNGKRNLWRTTYCNGIKVREQVEPDDPERLEYLAERERIFTEEKELLENHGITPKAASAAAWKTVYEQLWKRFGCCYYSCNSLLLNAFDPTETAMLKEVYELVSEITREQQTTMLYKGENELLYSKEDYHATWYAK